MADKLAYRGPEPRHFLLKLGDGSHTAGLYDHTAAVRDELYSAFETKADLIRADADLTEAGKAKKLRGLVEEFRGCETVKKLQKCIAAAHKQAEELREKLNAGATRDLDKLSPYQAVSLALSEQRAIVKFEALDALGRLQAVDDANLKGDTKLLALLAREKLIPESAVARVELGLQKAGDPATFAKLEELTGRRSPLGQVDVTSGALPVAEYCLGLFLRHCDESIGVKQWQRDAADAVDRGTAADGTITLPADDLNLATIDLAEARAAANGRAFLLEDKDGRQTAMVQPTNGARRDGEGQ